jgi:FixJ family two-component response regulator
MSDATVYVVDDDEPVRHSLRYLIESVSLQVRTYATAAEFLADYRPGGPACLLLDVRLPGMGGLVLQRELAAQGHTLPIIVITGHGDVAMATRAMRDGAVDFIEKPFRDDDLLERVHEALQLDRDRMAHRLAQVGIRQRLQGLTVRERQVLDLVVAGGSNRDIAAALGLGVKTIETHRAKLMKKMGASGLADLVRMAFVAQADREPGRRTHAPGPPSAASRRRDEV